VTSEVKEDTALAAFWRARSDALSSNPKASAAGLRVLIELALAKEPETIVRAAARELMVSHNISAGTMAPAERPLIHAVTAPRAEIVTMPRRSASSLVPPDAIEEARTA
jgi:hypothetical protein